MREAVARIAKLVKGLPERMLSVEKGYAQLATELSELKKMLDRDTSPESSDDGFQSLSRKDVIKVPDESHRMFLENSTFQPEEWLKALHEALPENMDKSWAKEWVEGEIEGQVLIASGKGWQLGKLRLNIEFCPDSDSKGETTD